MKEKIKTKIINLCPYLCGVLYSVFISLAGAYATNPVTRLLSSMPFIPEYGVYLGLSLSFLFLTALTVVFNVYVFRKKAITVGDIMFEILFPTIYDMEKINLCGRRQGRGGKHGKSIERYQAAVPACAVQRHCGGGVRLHRRHHEPYHLI